ncbi:MAG: hypothetical protein IJX72_04365 [Clostridia bacterium]|nr:hypothetical protein [Clostridia bacterium]
MTDRKQTRALNAFSAMSRVPDDFVLAAERMLYEAEAGIYRPEKPQGRFRRFLNSGWGAAVISGIVALAVLAFIIHAGVNAPGTYDPPTPPAGSTIEMSTEGVNYTLSTELENYPEGTERITAVMTGKTKGETVYQAAGWHLERLTSDGAEPVGSFHADDYGWHEPDADQYARIAKLIYIEEPLTPGTYRLHATKYDGEKYVSVAWCEFTVGEIAGESEGETQTTASPEAPKLPFTLTLLRSIYSTQDTILHLHFQANRPGVPLSRGDCWTVYRLEGEERVFMGSQSAEYAFEGEEVAPDEYAEETYDLHIQTATGGEYQTLPAGQYELVFEGYGITLTFEVMDLPEDTVTRFAYYLSSGLLFLEGTNDAADFILETWPCQI